MDQRAYQRRYYADPSRKPRMAPGRTLTVARHLEGVLDALAVSPPARILELGCGMGRFSVPLADAGFEVTAVDLSPTLLEVARAHDAAQRVRFLCADAAEVDRCLRPPFDAVVGFFFLHHLDDLTPTLRATARLLRPGGRVAFCEPNAWNPLYYAQILLTRGMTWKGDRGVARMRRGLLRGAWETAGLQAFSLVGYGLLPPFMTNRAAGDRLDRALDRVALWQPFRAYQIVSGIRGE